MTLHIPTSEVPGLARPLSRLVLGCDNKESLAEAAPLWDTWMELGGNAFDTAFVYGGGRHEAVLGEWLRLRGVQNDVNVICKGAHTPHCLPDAIGQQLAQSLARLGLARAPIYIMHRDNADVPVGEFVDAVNREIEAGRIGIWGGSNWSIARLADARHYAEGKGLVGPSLLNNNLSLASMEKPVWPGCVSSRDEQTRAFLTRHRITHLSWSSQARGYFLPEDLRNRLPEDTRPETCFGSPANAARRARSEQMAAERGLTANNVALAWVLAQPFPSFALVGPRDTAELLSTLPGATLELTPEEVAWLDTGA